MSVTTTTSPATLGSPVLPDAPVSELLRAAAGLLQAAYDRASKDFPGLSEEELLQDITAAQQVQNSAWAIQTHRLAQAAAIEHRDDPNPVEGALPRFITRVVRHEPGTYLDEWFSLEVGTRLGWSDRQATNRINDALDAQQHCPRLLDRVGAGGLDPWKATVIAHVSDGAPENVMQAIEDKILGSEPETTTAPKLRAKARRVRVRLDPVGADAASQARRRSAVGVWVSEHHEPGLSYLSAVLPTLDAAKLMAAIDQLARDLHDVTTTDKTLAECRVDALTDLTLTGVGIDTHLTFLIPVTTPEPEAVATQPPAPASESTPAEVSGQQGWSDDWPTFDWVDLDWSSHDWEDPDPDGLTWAEDGLTPINGMDLLDEELKALIAEELADLNATEQARTGDGSDPPDTCPPGCEHVPDPDNVTCAHRPRGTGGVIGDLLLPRAGIIPARTITEMTHLLGVKLTRALTDTTTGTVIETSNHSYRPGARLARYIQTRDQHCRFPGCTRPATLSDIDHVTRYPDGPTTAGNLQCLCRHHHRAKHEGGWKVTMTPTGVCTWTSPTGRTYITTPGD